MEDTRDQGKLRVQGSWIGPVGCKGEHPTLRVPSVWYWAYSNSSLGRRAATACKRTVGPSERSGKGEFDVAMAMVRDTDVKDTPYAALVGLAEGPERYSSENKPSMSLLGV